MDYRRRLKDLQQAAPHNIQEIIRLKLKEIDDMPADLVTLKVTKDFYEDIVDRLARIHAAGLPNAAEPEIEYEPPRSPEKVKKEIDYQFYLL